MVLAGGAMRSGRVIADWPGLDEAALYKRRDVMPTRDLRAHLAWLVRSLYGVARNALETTIFPSLDIGEDTGLLPLRRIRSRCGRRRGPAPAQRSGRDWI
ncbi:hypothetical protein [Antarctobacter sp.]|uniref:hypothetical protein n=1 Tax=Antarctobacter sp. TaxID=1872577 RepID=UPI002B271F7F|nr:hypothetical protein [Antarctobacter sp.]